jgi:hypothetical protein
MTPLAAYRAFHAAHAAHGPLVVGADAPEATGYRAWAACPCGASWERWVGLEAVLADLAPPGARAGVDWGLRR